MDHKISLKDAAIFCRDAEGVPALFDRGDIDIAKDVDAFLGGCFRQQANHFPVKRPQWAGARFQNRAVGIRWPEPDGKMGELKGDKAPADENDPAGKPVQLQKFTAGYHMLRAVYGQLHGNRTGGQNDEAGGQLLMVHADGMPASESGTSPYPIDAGLFQSADRIVRHPRRKPVFGVTQFEPAGNGGGVIPMPERWRERATVSTPS